MESMILYASIAIILGIKMVITKISIKIMRIRSTDMCIGSWKSFASLTKVREISLIFCLCRSAQPSVHAA